MENYLEVLKQALKDPKLEDLACISIDNKDSISKLLRDMPDGAQISEWRYGTGAINYEYHIHVNGTAAQLIEAFEKGARGGQPKLTALYSKENLRKIIADPEG